MKIYKAKKAIENLEEGICHLEEELRKIMLAEKSYFKLSLKNGTDVRESGLGWIVKKLEIK